MLGKFFSGILGGFLVIAVFLLILKMSPELIIEVPVVDSVAKSETSDVDNKDIVISIPDIIERANPSVVSIVATKDMPIYERYYEELNPFGWFGGFSVPRVRELGTEEKEVGGGSGFIISSDGLIVTNRHVIDDKDAKYSIILNDGSSYPAKIIAEDSVLDIAVIGFEVATSGLPYLEFSTTPVRLGETVIVIGNALAEFRNSVSVGIISGVSRSIKARSNNGVEELDEVIQTDAAINPGNSGGPMLNTEGKVIGVSVATSIGADNISFALPANAVSKVVKMVVEKGEISRPYLGVRYVMIDEELKELNNLPVDYGALVSRGVNRGELAVLPGSPADKASIIENDIILEVDGEKLDGVDLAKILSKKEVGQVINLKLLHKGEEKNVSLTLEAVPN